MSEAAHQPSAPSGSFDAEAASRGAKDAALSELYRRHWRELVRYVARGFGAGPPEPEDVAQAAFAHYAALAHPEAVDHPRAFLYRSARNFVIDQRRRALVRARAAKDAGASGEAKATDEFDAERVLAAKERLSVLESVIRSLKPSLRDVLILHRIEELSYAEIARRKGISQTHAKRLLAEALLMCERALRAAESKGRD